MKKIFSFLCLMCLFFISAGAQQTVFVQGHPRKMSAEDARRVLKVKTETYKFDASKVRYFVGEGSNTSYLIIDWRDAKGAQKLVWGYRYDGEDKTGEAMLRAVAKSDPRFYLLIMGGTQYGSAIGGLGFDLNGNKNIALNKASGESAETVEVDEDGCAYTSDYDFDDYSPADATDHWRSGWYKGYWSYWVADNPDDELGYSGLGATGRKLTNGSVDCWIYSPIGDDDTVQPEADYYTYLRPGVGITLPSAMTVKLSDKGVKVPYVLGLGENTYNKPTWSNYNENLDFDENVVDYVMSNDADGIFGDLTFKGHTGTVLLVSNLWLGEVYRDTCKLTVIAPEKPITSLAWQKAEVEAKMDDKVENPLTIEPEDRTWSGIVYESSDTKVATIDWKGNVRVRSNSGTATITAQSSFNPSVKATYTITVKNSKPVTEIKPVEGDEITMHVRDIHPKPEVTVLPEDATNKDVDYKIEDTEIASFYQKNIVAHKAGETKIIVSAKDGSGVTAEIKLIVKDQDRTPYDGYQDGTFILNEAWFGHENADMNFITADGQLMYRVYERENPNHAFGCTASDGVIYGGNMYVVSKQAKDGGDLSTTADGRLVVLDAKTLKKKAGFEKVGEGDGRSVVGVSPTKAYIGTTGGVYTFDAERLEVGHLIEGTQGESLYSGQIGGMLKGGNYVFVLQQDKGVHVINPETDMIVETIGYEDIQGIAQTPDGNVWLASADSLVSINPVTLEKTGVVILPNSCGPTCSWGAYRPTPFCASRTKNVLYWNGGADVTNYGSAFYRWETDKDISEAKAILSLDTLAAADADEKQISYGTIRYDDRTDELIVMATQSGWGANYEHNWIHFVDGETGAVKRTIVPAKYYWFQMLPIFPDKYAPEFADVDENMNLDVKDEPLTIDFEGKVTDKDNLVCNIVTALVDEGDRSVADVSFEDGKLTITPVAKGTSTIKLSAESNGVVTEQEVKIVVSETSGIGQVSANRAIKVEGGHLVVNGYDGWSFSLYNMAGQLVGTFTSASAGNVNVVNGTYIVKGHKGNETVSAKVAL